MRLIKRLVGGAAIALGLTVAVQTAANGLVEKMDLNQLTARADAIVVGSVTSQTSDDEGNGKIFTRFTIAVEDTWKGQGRSEVVVVVPGAKSTACVSPFRTYRLSRWVSGRCYSWRTAPRGSL